MFYNLKEEQEEMRKRQKPHPGPAPGSPYRHRAKLGSEDDLRRFIAAFCLMNFRGYTVSRAAAAVNIDFERLKAWDETGCQMNLLGPGEPLLV